ncbi:unnamed protein product [Ambrosiozyma monospora]|uniref:Unnamed protein product n=1 Tax=Ambrosiozyma monospora TaxID=43982 RepID=A0ACB5TCK2_AMBMO|nr:unnamed protein product [Ambrosiozyma monospora]
MKRVFQRLDPDVLDHTHKIPKIVPVSSSSGVASSSSSSAAVSGFQKGHHKSKSWAGSASGASSISSKQSNSRSKFNRSRANDRLPSLPPKDKPTTTAFASRSTTSSAYASGPLSPSLPPPPPSHLLKSPPSATVKHMLNMFDDDNNNNNNNNNNQIQSEPIPQRSTFLEVPMKLEDLVIPPRSPARLEHAPERSAVRDVNAKEEKTCAANANGHLPSIFERRAHARSSSLGVGYLDISLYSRDSIGSIRTLKNRTASAASTGTVGVSRAIDEVESDVDGGDADTIVSAHSGSRSFIKKSKSYGFNLSDKLSSRVNTCAKRSSLSMLRSIDNLSTSSLLGGSSSTSTSSAPRSRSNSNSMLTRKFSLSSVSSFKSKSKPAQIDNHLNQRGLVSSSRKSSFESVSSSSTNSSALNSDNVASSSSSTPQLTDSSTPFSTQSSTFSHLNSHESNLDDR